MYQNTILKTKHECITISYIICIELTLLAISFLLKLYLCYNRYIAIIIDIWQCQIFAVSLQFSSFLNKLGLLCDSFSSNISMTLCQCLSDFRLLLLPKTNGFCFFQTNGKTQIDESMKIRASSFIQREQFFIDIFRFYVPIVESNRLYEKLGVKIQCSIIYFTIH